MTLTATYENPISAVRPWFSIEAKGDVNDWERLPQQRIDVCLMCPFCAASCDRCDGRGNVGPERAGRGRPRKEIDYTKLREMMQLKKRNSEMCMALGVSNRTLVTAKNRILKEADHAETC